MTDNQTKVSTSEEKVKQIPKEEIFDRDILQVSQLYEGLFAQSIVIDGYQFYIYPIIASKRSLYFKNLIEDNLAEVKSGKFEFPNITFKINNMKNFTMIWNWINGFSDALFNPNFEHLVESINFMNYFELDFEYDPIAIDSFTNWIYKSFNTKSKYSVSYQNKLDILMANEKLIISFLSKYPDCYEVFEKMKKFYKMRRTVSFTEISQD